ncbi:glycosyltransferase [Mycolicibacterium palauense]|uniref:glycosyltransferase n=1 Tax=Mycolicibacterium palauense TaxID=2034511 RepID=UPI000BFEFF36|nr:glycosyltransferase [Mycolicibacterium palauense]
MIRILLVHPTPTRGGFTAVVSQAFELVKTGRFEVAVACQPGERVRELPPASKVVYLQEPLMSFRGVCRLRRAILTSNPHFVHFHGRKAGFIGRLVLPRSCQQNRVLYTPHGTPWVGQSFIRQFAGDFAERLLLDRTGAVLCVSHHEVEEWCRRDSSEKIHYLPNPVPPIRDIHQPQCPIDEKPTGTVLVPSGYNPQKRIEVVLEALALLRPPRPHTSIVGAVDRPGYRDYLVQLAARLGIRGDVTFGSNISDIRSALRDASLVVLPSYSEGFPIVGQEAIAEGARVAWSRIGAHTELFGETGAPFWTATDLAKILAGDHAKASVADRQLWLSRYARDVEKIRASYWNELAKSVEE